MKTVVYYFSATGNSLYVAKFLQAALDDAELRSIPEELFHGRFDAAADCVGFVFPMHCMGLPMQVESFMERLTIAGSPYIFAIATCGAPYIGQPFVDAETILAAKGQRLCASWYVRLVSNYLPLGDIPAEWRINIRARLAERKLKKIAAAVKDRNPHGTWQLLRKLCRRIHENWKEARQTLDEKFRCNTDICTSCGLCERVCPTRNISRPDGFPVWQHRCVNCLGCLHICPVKAVDYGEKSRGRRRYRHKTVAPKELLHDFSGERADAGKPPIGKSAS